LQHLAEPVVKPRGSTSTARHSTSSAHNGPGRRGPTSRGTREAERHRNGSHLRGRLRGPWREDRARPWVRHPRRSPRSRRAVGV